MRSQGRGGQRRLDPIASSRDIPRSRSGWPPATGWRRRRRSRSRPRCRAGGSSPPHAHPDRGRRSQPRPGGMLPRPRELLPDRRPDPGQGPGRRLAGVRDDGPAAGSSVLLAADAWGTAFSARRSILGAIRAELAPGRFAERFDRRRTGLEPAPCGGSPGGTPRDAWPPRRASPRPWCARRDVRGAGADGVAGRRGHAVRGRVEAVQQQEAACATASSAPTSPPRPRVPWPTAAAPSRRRRSPRSGSRRPATTRSTWSGAAAADRRQRRRRGRRHQPPASRGPPRAASPARA